MIKFNKMISANFITLLLTTTFLLVFPESPQASDKIFFANVLPENSYRVKWYKLVYTEAFRRLGIEFELKQYPMKRGPFLVNKGKLDGELGRVADFNTKYPNLLRVDEPLWAIKFSAYTMDKKIKLDSWESLQNKNLRVNYRRGVKKCEEMLTKVVQADKLEVVTADFQGLNKLLVERIDIYVGIEFIINPLLKTKEFSGIVKAGLMGEYQNYAFLHEKHKKLVPKLASVFKAMKEEGLFEQYDILAAE